MPGKIDLLIRKGFNLLSRDAGLCSPIPQGFPSGAAMATQVGTMRSAPI